MIETVSEIIISRKEIIIDGNLFDRQVTEIRYDARGEWDIIEFICYVENSVGIMVMNAAGDDIVTESIKYKWVRE